jgi:hypothetical protein
MCNEVTLAPACREVDVLEAEGSLIVKYDSIFADRDRDLGVPLLPNQAFPLSQAKYLSCWLDPSQPPNARDIGFMRNVIREWTQTCESLKSEWQGCWPR